MTSVMVIWGHRIGVERLVAELIDIEVASAKIACEPITAPARCCVAESALASSLVWTSYAAPHDARGYSRLEREVAAALTQNGS